MCGAAGVPQKRPRTQRATNAATKLSNFVQGLVVVFFLFCSLGDENDGGRRGMFSYFVFRCAISSVEKKKNRKKEVSRSSPAHTRERKKRRHHIIST
jgi:hypothetical protein